MDKIKYGFVRQPEALIIDPDLGFRERYYYRIADGNLTNAFGFNDRERTRPVAPTQIEWNSSPGPQFRVGITTVRYKTTMVLQHSVR